MKLMGLNFDDPASADAILEAAALVGPATVKQVHYFVCFEGGMSKVFDPILRN